MIRAKDGKDVGEGVILPRGEGYIWGWQINQDLRRVKAWGQEEVSSLETGERRQKVRKGYRQRELKGEKRALWGVQEKKEERASKRMIKKRLAKKGEPEKRVHAHLFTLHICVPPFL